MLPVLASLQRTSIFEVEEIGAAGRVGAGLHNRGDTRHYSLIGDDGGSPLAVSLAIGAAVRVSSDCVDHLESWQHLETCIDALPAIACSAGGRSAQSGPARVS